MRAVRFLFFLLSIAAGIGLGLAYGWLIKPPDPNQLTPQVLRADFKADYVLMVAQVYQRDQNLPQAVQRLSRLDPQSPARAVAEALLTARDLQYDPADLQVMSDLARALQTLETPAVPTGEAAP